MKTKTTTELLPTPKVFLTAEQIVRLEITRELSRQADERIMAECWRMPPIVLEVRE